MCVKRCVVLVLIGISQSNPYNVGLNPKVQLNNYGRQSFFGVQGYGDSFQNNSPYLLFDENMIRKMISENPEIKKILSEYKIPVVVNMKELEELKTQHCKDTVDIAVNIARNLPPALRQQINIKNLKDGALLHDFGKVMIPPEILNKPGELTPEEHKIMDLHTELGYQLLKYTGINQDVLKLVRYHHDNDYPDINLQIISLADKYSALTEKRVYKDKMTPKQALTTIYGDVKEGKVDQLLFAALVKSLQKQESPQIVNKY